MQWSVDSKSISKNITKFQDAEFFFSLATFFFFDHIINNYFYDKVGNVNILFLLVYTKFMSISIIILVNLSEQIDIFACTYRNFSFSLGLLLLLFFFFKSKHKYYLKILQILFLNFKNCYSIWNTLEIFKF